MKTKQTAPITPELLKQTSLPLDELMQALDKAGLLFPVLQAGMRNGYFADKASAKPMLLEHRVEPERITLRLSIQYESQMAGCACDDDPTAQQSLPEFLTCTLIFQPDGWLKEAILED